MIIDAHVHIQGSVYADDDRGGVTGLLQVLESAGIDRAVTVSLNPADNAAILAAAREHGERLVPFLVPDPTADPALSLAATLQGTAIKGIGEVYLRCGPASTPERHFRPVLELAREHHLPIMLHTGDFSYTAPLIMLEMFRAYPDVPFILAHMGSLAFALDAIEVARICPNVYLESSGMTSPAMLQRAIAECGQEKLIFGSDHPYGHPQVELARIDAAGFDPSSARMILGENISRLLDLSTSDRGC